VRAVASRLRCTFANDAISPAAFRTCLNSSDGSTFSLPTSYLFSPPTLPALFSSGVAPSANVTLLLNVYTVLSFNASTAFFFATTTPVAIGVRQPAPSLKPVATIRTSLCGSNTTDNCVLICAAQHQRLAVAPLSQTRSRCNLLCDRAGVREVFSTALTSTAPAVSLYLVPVSGGNAISRVHALNTSAQAQPNAMHLRPTLLFRRKRPCARHRFHGAAGVFVHVHGRRLLDRRRCTHALAFGVRAASNICPAGDRDTFTAPAPAGNFTLSVDIGQELCAPLTLNASISVSDGRRNVIAQPECVLEPFVAHNVSRCAWAVEQGDGFLSIELSIENSLQTLVAQR
jgi:hypothetical protein